MKKIFAAIAVLAAMALAMPVIAADAPGYGVTIGGRIKADMGWQVATSGDDTVAAKNPTDSTVVNFFAALNSSSYLRILFTSADKTTGIHLETGFFTTQNSMNNGATATLTTSDNFVYLRFAYGWWKVGSCKLMVGQYADFIGSNLAMGQNLGLGKSGKNDMAGFGFLGGGSRNPKVGLEMVVNENFTFVANIGQAGAENVFWSGTNQTASNSWVPKLEIGAELTFGSFKILPGAGISYQSLKIDDPLAQNLDDSALAFIVSLPVKYSNGPFWAMINGMYGQNSDMDWAGEATNSNAGMGGVGNSIFNGQRWALPYYEGNDVEDTTMWAAGFALGYDFSPQFGLKAGAGFANLSNDAWEVGNGKGHYTRWGAFIAAPYKITSNFLIQPEVSYWNYGDRVGLDDATGNQDAGDEWLLGVHFQFLF